MHDLNKRKVLLSYSEYNKRLRIKIYIVCGLLTGKPKN